MRIVASLSLILTGSVASAHHGGLIELAGNGPLIGGTIAIGIAIIGGMLKGRKRPAKAKA